MSMALPPVPSALGSEPSHAAAGGAEYADEEQRRGEARPAAAPLAPTQLQAEPRYLSAESAVAHGCNTRLMIQCCSTCFITRLMVLCMCFSLGCMPA